eukprot:gene8884-10414_t
MCASCNTASRTLPGVKSLLQGNEEYRWIALKCSARPVAP